MFKEGQYGLLPIEAATGFGKHFLSPTSALCWLWANANEKGTELSSLASFCVQRWADTFSLKKNHLLGRGNAFLQRVVRENQMCPEIVLTWTDATMAAASGGCVRIWDTTGVTCSMMQKWCHAAARYVTVGFCENARARASRATIQESI